MNHSQSFHSHQEERDISKESLEKLFKQTMTIPDIPKELYYTANLPGTLAYRKTSINGATAFLFDRLKRHSILNHRIFATQDAIMKKPKPVVEEEPVTFRKASTRKRQSSNATKISSKRKTSSNQPSQRTKDAKTSTQDNEKTILNILTKN